MDNHEKTPEFQEEQKGDIVILRLQGRLDAVSAPLAEEKVAKIIDHGQYKLILDLKEVTYMSSAGMRMLLSTTKKLHTLSGQLSVCSMGTNVMDVLKMSGFDHVLKLFKTEEEALQHFH